MDKRKALHRAAPAKKCIAVSAVLFLATFALFERESSDSGSGGAKAEPAHLAASAQLLRGSLQSVALKNENAQTKDTLMRTSKEKSVFLGQPPLERQAPRPFKKAMTTLFWAGERATSENDYIANSESFWDNRWAAHFGGVDDPNKRCGFHPCGFTPRENPFYVALPYGEFDDSGNLKQNAHAIAVHLISHDARQPSLKNHWVEIRRGDRTCYGQWEDVGPFEIDDFDYVFGAALHPKNRAGVSAGLDVSPAIWKCLGFDTNAVTSWRLVSGEDVPDGPWREIITKSGVSR